MKTLLNTLAIALLITFVSCNKSDEYCENERQRIIESFEEPFMLAEGDFWTTTVLQIELDKRLDKVCD